MNKENSPEEVLVKASEKLKPGEIELGRVNTVIGNINGNVKTFSSYSPENTQKSAEVLEITGTVRGSSQYPVKGALYPESFKGKPKFTLYRTFFDIVSKIDELHEKLNLAILNLGKIIYHVDDLGRVYFTDEEGTIYYLGSDKISCLSEDGLIGHLKKNEEGYDIELTGDMEEPYFDYYYITNKRFNDAVDSMEEEWITGLDDISKNPYTSLFYEKRPENKVIDISKIKQPSKIHTSSSTPLPKSKVIDIRGSLDRKEEGPHR